MLSQPKSDPASAPVPFAHSATGRRPADRKDERPYFDFRHLPTPAYEYVCWLDVMGAGNMMRRSLNIAANHVMKLHIACQEILQNRRRHVALFPLIDGVYICSDGQSTILNYVKEVLVKLALTFVNEDRHLHRFMVRGAIAFGPVIRGAEAHGLSRALDEAPDYTRSIVFGMPLSQAYAAERDAAPFGIYLHESARAFAPPGEKPLAGTHWSWWRYSFQEQDGWLAEELSSKLSEYFAWLRIHPTTTLYDAERMAVHLALVKEYFQDLERL